MRCVIFTMKMRTYLIGLVILALNDGRSTTARKISSDQFHERVTERIIYLPPTNHISSTPTPSQVETDYPLLFNLDMANSKIRAEVTATDLINFSKNFSLMRRTLDQNLNLINNFLDSGTMPIFQRAQSEGNATDMILDQLDRATVNESKFKTHQLLITSNVVVQTFKLKATNIVGMAIYKDEQIRIRIEEVYSNFSAENIIKSENFLAGVYLPAVLREQILASEEVPDPVVVVTVFLKDSLFAEGQEDQKKTNGIVFGVLIPEFNENFKAPIKIIYKVDENDVVSKRCAHWLYGNQIKGSWKDENSAWFCSGVEICEYYHVTHFGLLITDNEDVNRLHKTALDIITSVGCMLSIIGIFGIILTAILFKQWRANKGNIILTSYAVATLLEIVLLYASGHAKENSVCNLLWCYWSGIMLHYIVLAQFFWVLVISYLQYKRYVQIIGEVTTNLICKASLVGWAAPLLIVLPVAIFFSDNYANSHSAVCYPTGAVLYVTVLLPIFIIVTINMIIFGMIVKKLFANPKVRSTRMKNQNLIKFRLLVLLFFQLGISWIFGFLGNLHVALIYVFCLTATLQGFFVFLLFIVLNQPARLMYVKLLKGKPEKEDSTNKYAVYTSTTAEESRTTESNNTNTNSD